MAVQHGNNMNFDKTEVCINYHGDGRPKILNLNVDRIVSIQFDHGFKRKLLVKKVPCDIITITVRGLEEPFKLYSHEEGEYWPSYIEGLRKFCHDNRITLRDNL